MHDKLREFFNERFDELASALRKANIASSSTKGGAREESLRQALSETLPPLMRHYSGDIIDAGERSTGQLDGIFVHQAFPALLLSKDHAIVPAEGVVAVVESKSDLSKQWKEVLRTWDKIRVIRRAPTMVNFGSQPMPSDWAIPFIVVGLTGWKSEQRMTQAVRELQQTFGQDCPPVFLLNIKHRI